MYALQNHIPNLSNEVEAIQKQKQELEQQRQQLLRDRQTLEAIAAQVAQEKALVQQQQQQQQQVKKEGKAKARVKREPRVGGGGDGITNSKLRSDLGPLINYLSIPWDQRAEWLQDAQMQATLRYYDGSGNGKYYCRACGCESMNHVGAGGLCPVIGNAVKFVSKRFIDLCCKRAVRERITINKAVESLAKGASPYAADNVNYPYGRVAYEPEPRKSSPSAVGTTAIRKEREAESGPMPPDNAVKVIQAQQEQITAQKRALEQQHAQVEALCQRASVPAGMVPLEEVQRLIREQAEKDRANAERDRANVEAANMLIAQIKTQEATIESMRRQGNQILAQLDLIESTKQSSPLGSNCALGETSGSAQRPIMLDLASDDDDESDNEADVDIESGRSAGAGVFSHSADHNVGNESDDEEGERPLRRRRRRLQATKIPTKTATFTGVQKTQLAPAPGAFPALEGLLQQHHRQQRQQLAGQ